jgi:hypothetical protein
MAIDFAARLSRGPNDGESPTYRIERRGAGVLHLYRGGELVDVDREQEGDSRRGLEGSASHSPSLMNSGCRLCQEAA